MLIVALMWCWCTERNKAKTMVNDDCQLKNWITVYCQTHIGGWGKEPRMAQWKPPARDRIKVNLDGALGKAGSCFCWSWDNHLCRRSTSLKLKLMRCSKTFRSLNGREVDNQYFAMIASTTASHHKRQTTTPLTREPASERNEVSASSSFNPVSNNLCGS
jgi:hypothetical protein